MSKSSDSKPSDRERDARLVARVLDGDQEAFGSLYDAYFRRVYAFVLRRVGDAAEAEDLTQETFVQLYRSLGSFEGRSSLATWIFGIAHNVCSRHFRHCSRWMVGARDARELEERPVASRTEQRVDAARVLRRCDAVLARSRRPAHREIFRLRYADLQPIRSIADRVGKSNDAVKISLRRSRAALAEGVPELGIVLDDMARSA